VQEPSTENTTTKRVNKNVASCDSTWSVIWCSYINNNDNNNNNDDNDNER
jgi:hypothetical protein